MVRGSTPRGAIQLRSKIKMSLSELVQQEPTSETNGCTHPNAKILMYHEKTHLAYLGCPDCKIDFTKHMTDKEFQKIKENIFKEYN